ncbi:hypothetical protein [Niabella hibiscisoli]|uniref:hypothetical protein n=1 Tax=Niabella hibiscisoli TaxID=1825928 RepID=UPI001F0F7104|nr:hypothetical protein [Niabella hibiscisoli]MCH5717639.1 hypothetical protein [Niabella hibiscisoli]
MITKNSLWVVGISDTLHKDRFQLSSVSFFTQYTKGLSKHSTIGNWDINILGAVNYSSDSTSGNRNLKRGLIEVKPLINYVMKNRDNDYSCLEIALGASYLYRLARIYPGEEKNAFYANAVARIRLKDDIWLPLEVKYDPKNGKLFGLLSARINFNSILN